jgi:heterotetrameric sarcosine oxidase gamma subunit
VVDVTHAHALLRLTGTAASGVLEKLCPVDLADPVTPDGAAFRSLVAGVTATVVRDDVEGGRSYLLQCGRSYGQYLRDALLDAGTELVAVADATPRAR